MKYTFCFFPWVGAVIGGCFYCWHVFCTRYSIGAVCRAAIGMAIPLLLTGGFHVDGFMDTMDAFHSYQEKERKLEILKDSHIGAFAVIMFMAYGLVWLGAFSEIKEDAAVKIICCGFVLSRCLSGISAVSFPLAKMDGMLFLFADSAQRKIVKGSLYIQSAACIGAMFYISLWEGLFAAAAALAALLYYKRRSQKEFGGVTGDTAGYFVLLCEGCMAAVVAVVNIVCRF